MTTPQSTRQAVTELLGEWSNGDEEAVRKLFPLVPPELHRLAHHNMSRERTGRTRQTTAVLKEAYLQLVAKRTLVHHAMPPRNTMLQASAEMPWRTESLIPAPETRSAFPRDAKQFVDPMERVTAVLLFAGCAPNGRCLDYRYEF